MSAGLEFAYMCSNQMEKLEAKGLYMVSKDRNVKGDINSLPLNPPPRIYTQEGIVCVRHGPHLTHKRQCFHPKSPRCWEESHSTSG